MVSAGTLPFIVIMDDKKKKVGEDENELGADFMGEGDAGDEEMDDDEESDSGEEGEEPWA